MTLDLPLGHKTDSSMTLRADTARTRDRETSRQTALSQPRSCSLDSHVDRRVAMRALWKYKRTRASSRSDKSLVRSGNGMQGVIGEALAGGSGTVPGISTGQVLESPETAHQ